MSTSSGRHPSGVPMQELDPSPVTDSPISISKSDYFAPSTSYTSQPSQPPSSSSSSHSSFSAALFPTFWQRCFPHSPPFYLLRTQRYSSYLLSSFLGLHIANTSLVPLLTRSVATSEPYLLLTRPYYQSPLFEPLLVLGPLAAHVGSGVALRLYRRRQTVRNAGAENRAERKKVAWPKVSGISWLGYALWPLLAAHVFVNRITPLRIDGDSSGVNLGYVSHGFAKHPAVAFTTYVALVGVGVWHIVWGWAKWLDLTPDTAKGEDGAERGLRRKRRWYAVNALAALTTGVWMAGGLGVVGRGGESKGWVGKGFNKLYRSVPLVGSWLVQ
ncbi:MAG: hypothetical protein LQ340_000175 [Diploschistes diacapsis]|nr:MAG: hypothetical protein LQ340_000175 [Diploschistes diacapsis]